MSTTERGRPLSETGLFVRKTVLSVLQNYDSGLTPSQLVSKVSTVTSDNDTVQEKDITKSRVLAALRYHEKQGVVSKLEGTAKASEGRGRPERIWSYQS